VQIDDKRRRFEAEALPHLDAAYNLARWLTRSAGDADDIVQEAMLRAFRGFDGLRGADVKPWLLTIVRNVFLSAVPRARRKLEPLPDEGEGERALVDGTPDPERTAIGADYSRKLGHVIAALPEEFREALTMREMEDMSYRDIAQATGVPIGTVMSRLARARALLKERWLSDVEGVGHGVR
jgi:RNA polymerase sigma-70 factor (ECF subfamily)